MFLKVINDYKNQVEFLNCSYIKDDKDRLVFCSGDRNISILKNKNMRKDYMKIIEDSFLKNKFLTIENLKDSIEINVEDVENEKDCVNRSISICCD